MRAVKNNLPTPSGEVGGIRRPSPGLMARLGVPVGGRVRKLRAVEDQLTPIPEEITSKLGGSIWKLVRRPQGTGTGAIP